MQNQKSKQDLRAEKRAAALRNNLRRRKESTSAAKEKPEDNKGKTEHDSANA